MALLRTTHTGPKSTRWSSLALEDGATALEQLAGAKLTPTLDRAPGVRSRRRDSYAGAAPKYEWMTRLGESRPSYASVFG
jgi:hypothetical protein